MRCNNRQGKRPELANRPLLYQLSIDGSWRSTATVPARPVPALSIIMNDNGDKFARSYRQIKCRHKSPRPKPAFAHLRASSSASSGNEASIPKNMKHLRPAEIITIGASAWRHGGMGAWQRARRRCGAVKLANVRFKEKVSRLAPSCWLIKLAWPCVSCNPSPMFFAHE